MIGYVRRLAERRLVAVTFSLGALTAGLGTAGVVALATAGSTATQAAAAAAAAPATVHVANPGGGGGGGGGGGSDPYFVCLSYEWQWGICIGPPTN